MKAVAYDGQKTLIECNPLQYCSLRNHGCYAEGMEQHYS